ncbi:DUF6368 family protein [Streptomyces cyaneofuscatus]|uniref:DUF6368 family protein n=1 Tax=Streptomyces cyaneofuscatus TaxID=66883 RepID=UPI0036E78D09
MSGPAIGLWLFEPRGFADILADVVPWLETFCKPVEAKASGDVDFWVRDGSALGLQAFAPVDVGVFFLSEDEEIPAEDEDYSAFSRSPVLGADMTDRVGPRACAGFPVCGGNTPCPACPPSRTVRRHRAEARAYTGRMRSAFRCGERSRKPVCRTAPACPPTVPSPPPSPCTVTAG